MTANRAHSVEVQGAMLTACGPVRAINEDRVAYAVRKVDSGREIVAVVCDGMGGHAGGERASELAAEIVVSGYWSPAASPAARLQACLREANAAILAEANADPALRGMGTTCTAVAFRDACASVAHVGDSRAYLIREGAITQLTDDQTLVARLVRNGLISPQEAATHPERHVILQALGTHEGVRPAMEDVNLLAGDIVLLCSDGLSGFVEDDDIRSICTSSPPFEACTQLIERAISNGGTDNVSVGVFHVRAEGENTAPCPDTRVLFSYRPP